MDVRSDAAAPRPTTAAPITRLTKAKLDNTRVTGSGARHFKRRKVNCDVDHAGVS